MKILVVGQHYYPEGTRVTDICEDLVRRGHDVTMLTGLPNYPEGVVPKEYRHGKNRVQEIGGVHVIRAFEIGRRHNLLFRFLNYYSYPLSACRKAKKLAGDFDVVYCYQVSPVMMIRPGITYKKKFGKPLLVYATDQWPASLCAGGVSKNSPLYRAYLPVSRSIYGAADRTLVSSRLFIDYFRNELGLGDMDIRYCPQYAEAMFEDEDFTVPVKDTVDLVFAGNIGRAQSVETIIRAAALLEDEKQLRFHLVGDGTSLPDCRALAEELGVGDRVIFHGRHPLSDMPEFYRMADAMLITLYRDEVISATIPSKLQTYMAAGKPVIGAIDGETPLVIGEAECGFCGPSEDPEALAANIRKFLSLTAEERASLGAASKRYYLSHFRKKDFMDLLETQLYELAGIRKPEKEKEIYHV